MQKYSDDTAIVGRVKDGREGEYRSLFEDFVKWCRSNCLQLNTSKTKEMVVSSSTLWFAGEVAARRGTLPDWTD